MQAHNLIQFPNQLEALENEAQAYLEDSIEAFRQFVATLQVIQDSGLYEGTWDNYLRTRWHIADSTFRNYRAQANSAEIMLSVVDSTVTKAQAAKVSRILSKLPNDTELRLSAYAKAYEKTGNITPSEAEIKIACEALEEVKQGIYTINGVSMPKSDFEKHVVNENIDMALYEKNQRKTAHIDESMGIERKRFEIKQKDHLAALGDMLGIDLSCWQDVAIVGSVRK